MNRLPLRSIDYLCVLNLGEIRLYKDKRYYFENLSFGCKRNLNNTRSLIISINKI